MAGPSRGRDVDPPPGRRGQRRTFRSPAIFVPTPPSHRPAPGLANPALSLPSAVRTPTPARPPDARTAYLAPQNLFASRRRTSYLLPLTIFSHAAPLPHTFTLPPQHP